MNEYDIYNLQFLLQASKEVIIDWYNNVDEADRRYAFSLLFCYRLELIDMGVNDCTQALELINKIK